jgi:nucleoside-diphosphate-sugar epimerase
VNRVLVTGATGFIGAALVRRLKQESYEVIELSSRDGDIADSSTLDNFASDGLMRVFHLAGMTYVPDSWKNPSAFYRTNVLGTVNVAEYCRLNNVPLTYLSAYIYGRPEILPISEDSLIAPNNPYAFSKYAAENVCEFYSRNFGVSCAVIRPFNVYGAGQSSKFLIPTIIAQVLHDDAITVDDLNPRRDYLNIDDLVDAIIRTLNCRHPYKVYNVGSGSSLGVGEIIRIIQQCAKTNKPVFCREIKRTNEIADVVADISRVQNDLGWQPKLSFIEGIHKIIQAEFAHLPPMAQL